jgi:asparagine synthase (glutamine-hydrolysing)
VAVGVRALPPRRRQPSAAFGCVEDMCGILFTSDSRTDDQTFDRSLRLLDHRGPDAPPAAFREGPFRLGHTRLKILDLDDRSNQPFHSADGRYVVVYNGEIYNFRELAAAHGIHGRTTSDTEVLLELYARCGPPMLRELNGMFAFVVLDRVARSVFVARDRLGVKPLYVATIGDGVAFSSEVAPLLALGASSEPDGVGLRQYLKLRACFGGRTIYDRIRVFPAGHFLADGRVQRYWDLPRGPQAAPEPDELEHLTRAAVTCRCIADVPVGCFLSGGLDSTVVAALAPVRHTWVAGFADDNEFEYARLAADAFGTEHTEVLVDPEEYVETARCMIRKRLEPLSVPNEVSLYLLAQRVKTKNTVVLSGEGADELFFGYDRVFRWAATHPFDLHAFASLYAYGSHEDPEIVEDAIAPFALEGGALEIVARFFQVAHLHGLLRRLDNSTMLSGVEARVPFVDYRLVERLAGVSLPERMRGGTPKGLLKDAFAAAIPRPCLERPKVGFPVPLAALDLRGEGTAMDRWLRFNLSVLGIDDLRDVAARVPSSGAGAAALSRP